MTNTINYFFEFLLALAPILFPIILLLVFWFYGAFSQERIIGLDCSIGKNGVRFWIKNTSEKVCVQACLDNVISDENQKAFFLGVIDDKIFERKILLCKILTNINKGD